jgi:hypothetical protein
MANIYVQDYDTHQGLAGCWFDHPYYDGGQGFYQVTMDPQSGDYSLVCGRSGYDNANADIRFSSIISLQKTGSDGGGGWF